MPPKIDPGKAKWLRQLTPETIVRAQKAAGVSKMAPGTHRSAQETQGQRSGGVSATVFGKKSGTVGLNFHRWGPSGGGVSL